MIFSKECPSLLTHHFQQLHNGSGISVEVIRERGYKSVLDKAPDDGQLQNWQDTLQPHLWGIITNDRVAVLDADTPDTRAQLEAEIGEPHVLTPRGGAHWYIDTAGHPMKTIAGLLPGVDVRGVGGFVNIAGGKGVEHA
ncbi:MAG: bifunctional DNA primase/polymerase [Kiritimatiellota bacterium]|nr:bifunctional DNA primase/polymerase [Kiritimatiellota bacterium]